MMANISYVCNVYGPTHCRDKKNFWNSLATLKEEMEGKEIIIVGDFNVTIALAEKRGSSSVYDPYEENMEDLISMLDLIDMPLKNGKYTWNNRRMGQVMSRPDSTGSW